jgi:hypothetical protein
LPKSNQAVANYKKAVGEPAARAALIARLDHVRGISENFGYGVAEDMRFPLANYYTEGED